jgi:hypothetical protein
MNGIKGKAILKDDVLQIIDNHANYHTFVDDDAFQKFKSDIESLITFDMTVKVYSEHYCKECRKQFACGCTSDMLMSCADFEPAIENESTEQNHDAVNHPNHYCKGGIECIEALKAATTRLTGIEAVCTANAIKYLWRWRDKNGAEDIRKAIWYCERLLKEIGDERKE